MLEGGWCFFSAGRPRKIDPLNLDAKRNLGLLIYTDLPNPYKERTDPLKNEVGKFRANPMKHLIYNALLYVIIFV